MTLVVKWCLIKIPVCGGVVGDPCVGVGGGVGVGRTTDVEPPSGEPVEDVTEHKPLCQLLATCLLLATWAYTHLSLQLSMVDIADSLLQIVYQCWAQLKSCDNYLEHFQRPSPGTQTVAPHRPLG